MEGHCSGNPCMREAYVNFHSLINKLPVVPTLGQAVDCFPPCTLRVLTTSKILVYWSVIWLWAVSFWYSFWGTYPVNSYMVSELFEGRVRWWSKSEAGRTACGCRFLDLLFLTAFGPRGLLCCVRSICSSEEPLSFHAKRFPVALAASFFWSGGIQCFLQFTVIFSLLILVSVYLAFFFNRIYTFHFCVCSLPCDSMRSGQIRNRKEGFFSCVCSFPCTLVWSRKIRNIEKNI